MWTTWPLPTSTEGYQYLFTMVDKTSRLCEAVPFVKMETEACADVLINTLVSRFDVHTNITSGQGWQLTSGQGWQFTSNLWAHACQA